MKNLRARQPIVLLAGLILLLMSDHAGFVRMALGASLLHEGGHVLAYCAMARRLPVLRFSAGGIGLLLGGESFAAGQQLWLAAAGPLANFAICILLLLRLQAHASYWGYFFASANLCVGLFNLLPIAQLDGRRILQVLAKGEIQR